MVAPDQAQVDVTVEVSRGSKADALTIRTPGSTSRPGKTGGVADKLQRQELPGISRTYAQRDAVGKAQLVTVNRCR